MLTERWRTQRVKAEHQHDRGHQQETKAAAFVVCEALGLKAKTAFADCQLYHGDARLLTESLEVVHHTAAQVLGAISPEDIKAVQ